MTFSEEATRTPEHAACRLNVDETAIVAITTKVKSACLEFISLDTVPELEVAGSFKISMPAKFFLMFPLDVPTASCGKEEALAVI
jgi:hypothetical protein